MLAVPITVAGVLVSLHLTRGRSGNGIVEPGESCDDFNTAAGDCCSPTCTLEPAGSACPGDGDLCTPGTCDGAGTCLHENACVDQPLDGVKLKIQRSGEKQSSYGWLGVARRWPWGRRRIRPSPAPRWSSCR